MIRNKGTGCVGFVLEEEEGGGEGNFSHPQNLYFSKTKLLLHIPALKEKNFLLHPISVSWVEEKKLLPERKQHI